MTVFYKHLFKYVELLLKARVSFFLLLTIPPKTLKPTMKPSYQKCLIFTSAFEYRN